MITNATATKMVADSSQTSMVNYFGLLVELIDPMDRCSLIRYRDRELVVDTDDLQEVSALKHAA